MSFIPYNANPDWNIDGDCTVRAIATATERSWDETYFWLCMQGFMMKRMPSSNVVWNAYLKHCGFERSIIPNTCPECYTVIDFCKENPSGVFLLGTGEHVVAVIDGDYYDTWDSGDEVPIYYWRKER